MKLLLFVAAERVIRDSDEDRMTVVDIVDSIAAEGFPYYISRLSLLMIYHREETDSDTESVVITIRNNDHEMASREQKVRFSDKIGNRTVTDLNGFLLSQPGSFSVTIMQGDKELGKWSIPVALDN